MLRLTLPFIILLSGPFRRVCAYNKREGKGIFMEIVYFIVLLIAILAVGVVAVIALILARKRSNASTDVEGIPPELGQWMQEEHDRQIKENAEFKATVQQSEQNIAHALQLSIDKQIDAQKLSIQEQFTQIVTNNSKQMSDFQSTMAKTQQDQAQQIQNAMNAQTKANTERLVTFQGSMTDSLTKAVEALTKQVNDRLQGIDKKVDDSLQQGFKTTSESMANLQKELVMVQDAQKNIDDLQGQISKLSGILSNNQQRGMYGEWQLELLLESIFEPANKGILYDTQYILKPAKGDDPGLKPDAVVFLDGKGHRQIVCIDSKFSLTGYEQLFQTNSTPLSKEESDKAKQSFAEALKKRIDETSKYIIEGKTTPNALMFIPSDGIFAFVENELKDVVNYAERKKVVLTCPSIIRSLLASFRVIQIDESRSENIEKINKALHSLGEEFKRFLPRWDSLQRSISLLSKNSGNMDTTIRKIDRRFQGINQADEKSMNTIDADESEPNAPLLESLSDEQ